MPSDLDFSKDLTSKCHLTNESSIKSSYHPLEQGNFNTTALPTLRDLGILNLVKVPKDNHLGNESEGEHSDEFLSDELRGANACRRRVSNRQKDILNRVFRQYFFPSTELRNRLAQELEMTPRAVQIWFQNKRQAWRAKNKMTTHALIAPQYMRSAYSVPRQPYQPPLYSHFAPYPTKPYYQPYGYPSQL